MAVWPCSSRGAAPFHRRFRRLHAPCPRPSACPNRRVPQSPAPAARPPRVVAAPAACMVSSGHPGRSAACRTTRRRTGVAVTPRARGLGCGAAPGVLSAWTAVAAPPAASQAACLGSRPPGGRVSGHPQVLAVVTAVAATRCRRPHGSPPEAIATRAPSLAASHHRPRVHAAATGRLARLDKHHRKYGAAGCWRRVQVVQGRRRWTVGRTGPHDRLGAGLQDMPWHVRARSRTVRGARRVYWH